MHWVRCFFIFTLLMVTIAYLDGCSAVQPVPNANLALGQLETNPKKAWDMIRVELEHPKVSSQADLCELNVIAIQILGHIVKYDSAPSDADRIAKRSYDYVNANCQTLRKMVAIAENQYGLYFIKTGRTGKAIKHFKRSNDLSERRSFEHMCNENTLAICYADMGKFELRDKHARRAIELGWEYFKTPRTYKYKMDEGRRWLTFMEILTQRLDHLAWGERSKENLSEMYSVWNQIEQINTKWVSKPTQYLAYTNSIQRFAEADQTTFAKSLLSKAKKLVEKYSIKNQKFEGLDLKAAEAKILGAEGKFRESAALWEDWLKQFPIVTGKSPLANSFRLVGLAQEAAENYNLAIEHLEKCILDYESIRSTFVVKSRTRVLSGLVIKPYWGLVRSYGHQYIEKKREEDYWKAVNASRRLRARQFGELLGIEGLEKSNIQTLKLQPHELLLNIVTTDSALVVFAISNQYHDLFIVPYNRHVFDATIRRVKSQLSNLEGPENLVKDIQWISNLVLAPIRGKLNGIKRLIVVSDGYLNAIPPTLLSKSPKEYHPLILDHEVTLTPSISYFIDQRKEKAQFKSDTLFALGDPAFGSRSVPAGYRDRASAKYYQRVVNSFNLFVPLPETRTEVGNIASLFEDKNVTSLFGNLANESKVKKLRLDRYRYLHFATHGVLGNQLPGIDEPALVLSAEPQGSTEDGFLTRSEVEELKLNSELAVLSACNTGSGKYFTGEGIMGLGRSFLLAGSKSVVVSLWPVASEATVKLMTRFYKLIRSGKSKAESLRLAQLSLIRKTKTKTSGEQSIKIYSKADAGTYATHPYYWAPFVLIGE